MSATKKVAGFLGRPFDEPSEPTHVVELRTSNPVCGPSITELQTGEPDPQIVYTETPRTAPCRVAAPVIVRERPGRGGVLITDWQRADAAAAGEEVEGVELLDAFRKTVGGRLFVYEPGARIDLALARWLGIVA